MGRAAPGVADGVEAVFILVLVAAVYPVIHARRLETVEVLRSS